MMTENEFKPEFEGIIYKIGDQEGMALRKAGSNKTIGGSYFIQLTPEQVTHIRIMMGEPEKP